MSTNSPEYMAAYRKKVLSTPEGRAKHNAKATAYQRQRLRDPDARAKHNSNVRKSRKIRDDFRKDLLAQFPCHCCGNPDPITMDWHHVNPEDKRFEIKRGLTKSHDEWWEEVLKCIPTCCNCHRKLHRNTLCLLPQSFRSE